MSDLDATTPRVFLARHGETEWTKNGRYTGTTDLELTPTGMRQVTTTGTHLVGPGKLIDLHRVARIWVSPRKRAQQTLCLLVGGDIRDLDIADKVVLTEDIAEWDYGDYEGLVVHEIHAQRREKGLDREREWNIWRDGCEGGEYDLPIYSAGSDESNQVADVMDVIPRSAQHVAERLDRLIAQIREIQAPCMNGEKPADVVLIAHGLILRAFVKRWLKYPLDNPLSMMMSPGGIGILSYKNHNIDQQGFFVGMALPSQV